MNSTKTVCCAAYCRVSTLLGQDPKLQLVRIEEFAQARGFELVGRYLDYASGTKEKRPALDQMLRDARLGKFKILVVTGIDRLGRSCKHLLTLIDELQALGISFISLRESIDLSTPMGKAALAILSAVAQLERDLTSERIKTALAAKRIAAKNAGAEWRCGRPVVLTDQMQAEVHRLRAEGVSIRKIAAKLGISKTSVQRALGVPFTHKKDKAG